MPFPFLALGAGLSAANAIGRWIGGAREKKLANKINPVFNQYKESPYAKSRLGLASRLFNGRMAGATDLERNIFSNQANYMANVDRNSTDSGDALVAAAAGIGTTNQALSDLQTQEKQNKYAMLSNLNEAYAGMVNEGDKEYQSMLDKYQMDVQQKNALRGAGANNQYGAISDLGSLGIQLSSLFGGNIKKPTGVKPGGIGIKTNIPNPNLSMGQKPTIPFRPLFGAGARYNNPFMMPPPYQAPAYSQNYYGG